MKGTYSVRAKRWVHGWELHIEGVGITQSRSLAEAETIVRDYISVDLDVPAHSFDIEIIPEMGGGLDEEVTEARRQVLEAKRAQTEAAERSRRVVRKLKANGLSGKDTAAVLGISPQRVSQLSEDGQNLVNG